MRSAGRGGSGRKHATVVRGSAVSRRTAHAPEVVVVPKVRLQECPYGGGLRRHGRHEGGLAGAQLAARQAVQHPRGGRDPVRYGSTTAAQQEHGSSMLRPGVQQGASKQATWPRARLLHRMGPVAFCRRLLSYGVRGLSRTRYGSTAAAAQQQGASGDMITQRVRPGPVAFSRRTLPYGNREA